MRKNTLFTPVESIHRDSSNRHTSEFARKRGGYLEQKNSEECKCKIKGECKKNLQDEEIINAEFLDNDYMQEQCQILLLFQILLLVNLFFGLIVRL